MIMEDMVAEIKADLGADINSLGISDTTIMLKIKEAIRKISVYTPCVKSGYFEVHNLTVDMPEDTVGVLQVLNQTDLKGNSGESTTLYQNDTDLFSVSRYMFNYNDLSDPFIFLMQKNQLNTIQNFISLKDWRYDNYQNTLYLNNFSGKSVSCIYMSKFTDLQDMKDQDIIQAVKEYALALCKIIEGEIRRKLQVAPGAINMDGDALVSEGQAEKLRLDEWIPKRFMNLRFGLRV